MERNRYSITKKNIPIVKLTSLTGQTWYDSNEYLVQWSGLTSAPITGYTVFNVTGGTVDSGFYTWGTPSGNTWNLKEIAPIKNSKETDVDYYNRVSSKNFDDYQIPIYLDAKADEMGQMVDFDGNIGQNIISANFTYEINGKNVRVYNTTNYGKLRNNQFDNVIFTISWGDGAYSGITKNGYVDYTYETDGTYEVIISLDSPWTLENVKKIYNTQPPPETYYLLQETNFKINLEDLSGSILI